MTRDSTVSVTDVLSALSSPSNSKELLTATINCGNQTVCLCICASEKLDISDEALLQHGVHIKRIAHDAPTELCILFKVEQKSDQELEAINNELDLLYSSNPRMKDPKHVDQLVQERIRLLHDYNEAKDAGQALLGRLAHLEGCTTKEMYSQFDLSLDE